MVRHQTSVVAEEQRQALHALAGWAIHSATAVAEAAVVRVCWCRAKSSFCAIDLVEEEPVGIVLGLAGRRSGGCRVPLRVLRGVVEHGGDEGIGDAWLEEDGDGDDVHGGFSSEVAGEEYNVPPDTCGGGCLPPFSLRDAGSRDACRLRLGRRRRCRRGCRVSRRSCQSMRTRSTGSTRSSGGSPSGASSSVPDSPGPAALNRHSVRRSYAVQIAWGSGRAGGRGG